MQSRKVCVVTGANAGIGRETCRGLAAAGVTAVMVCRNAVRGEAARSAIAQEHPAAPPVLELCDMSSLAAVRGLAGRLLERFARLDALINNAAIFDISAKQARLTNEGHEILWAANHLGPFLLSHLLLERIVGCAGRVINISSKGLVAYPFLDLDYNDLDSRARFGMSRAYYRSKLAQCAFTIDLAARMEAGSANAIRVPAVAVADDRLPDIHPLLLWVYRQKRKAALSPERMAETYVWLALDPVAAELSGSYVDERRRVMKFPRRVRDPAWRARLWDESARLVGL